MKSRRIDGATTLDLREAAIKEFNSPTSGECCCVDTTSPHSTAAAQLASVLAMHGLFGRQGVWRRQRKRVGTCCSCVSAGAQRTCVRHTATGLFLSPVVRAPVLQTCSSSCCPSVRPGVASTCSRPTPSSYMTLTPTPRTRNRPLPAATALARPRRCATGMHKAAVLCLGCSDGHKQHNQSYVWFGVLLAWLGQPSFSDCLQPRTCDQRLKRGHCVFVCCAGACAAPGGRR